MNIVFVTPEYITEDNYDGGLANYLYNICTNLSKRKHNIFVITASFENTTLNHDGTNVIRVNVNSRFLDAYKLLFKGQLYTPVFWILQSYFLNKALKNLYKKTQIDIVQYASYTATALFRKPEIASISRISSYQPLWDQAYNIKKTPSSILKNYLETLSLKRTDAIFGPSLLIADMIASKINKHVKTIESPVFFPKNIDYGLYNKIMKGKKYIMFYGSLGALKGVIEISEIIFDFLRSHPDFYFLFIGKDLGHRGQPMMDLLRKKAGVYMDRCIYHCSVTKEHLIPFIKNADAIILPSRTDNLPNTCIESMALGKIVIATKGNCFEQLIDDKRNGYLCNARDPDSLIRTINDVLSLEIKKKKLVEQKARDTVARLNPSSIITQLENLYIEVINSKNLIKP